MRSRSLDIHEKILGILADSNWHGVEDIALSIKAHPSSVSNHLYFLLSRGKVLWKPKPSPHGPLKMMFKLIDDSPGVRQKPYPHDPLGSEIDEALRNSVGNRFYYSGAAALFLYNLFDRFANLNLAEVHVPRKQSESAVGALNDHLSESYIVVPDRMPWEHVMQAMQIGNVLRVVPHYRRSDKANVLGRNVQKIEVLLSSVKSYSSPSEFKSIASLAADQGLINDEAIAKV